MAMNSSPDSTFLRWTMRRSGWTGGASTVKQRSRSLNRHPEARAKRGPRKARGHLRMTEQIQRMSNYSVSIFTALVIVFQALISLASQVRASSRDFEGAMMKLHTRKANP